MIFVAAKVFSQKLPATVPKFLLLQPVFQSHSPPKFILKRNIVLPQDRNIIPADLYVRHLGFFCKQEIKLEKATKIPFKFRLGSVNDCERLEGKYRRN